MVYGTITRLGNLFSINSFMVDVETGAQVRSATSDLRGGIEEALTELMARNASELLGLTTPSSSTQAYFDSFSGRLGAASGCLPYPGQVHHLDP